MDVRERDSLRIGQAFPQDLLDGRGTVLLEAGECVSQELVDKLASLGSSQVFIASEPADLTHYASNEVQALKDLFDDAPSLMENVAEKLRSGEYVKTDEVDEVVDQCLVAVASDSCAVLATAIVKAEDDETVYQRNLRLSSIAMVVAREFGCSRANCEVVGRAGLLCDISLPADILRLDQIPPDTTAYDRALSQYLQHPLTSVDMLHSSMPGISPLELILVSQSHEQCDGRGFPRGLRERYLHPLGRLLNVVDAFLTLTDPEDPLGRIVPADALAYLALHSLYGSFDVDSVRALISAAAIYPVGTDVTLSDATTGRVVRSSGSDYMDPIIQVDGSTDLLALSQSDKEILSPLVDNRQSRLPKSKFNDNLWQRAA